jgi:hypothetical protein
MARDQVDMTPIETREELIAWFEAGSKPKSQFRIGTAHEKFVFTVEGHNPVPYDGSCRRPRWVWSLFGILGKPLDMRADGRAPTLEAAKADFEANWRNWLRRAKLRELLEKK